LALSGKKGSKKLREGEGEEFRGKKSERLLLLLLDI